MKILYFADIRHKIGHSEEDFALSADISTVAELVQALCKKGDSYASAFADLKIVRVAINCDFSDMTAVISDNDEVAFFPPVTGG